MFETGNRKEVAERPLHLMEILNHSSGIDWRPLLSGMGRSCGRGFASQYPVNAGPPNP